MPRSRPLIGLKWKGVGSVKAIQEDGVFKPKEKVDLEDKMRRSSERAGTWGEGDGHAPIALGRGRDYLQEMIFNDSGLVGPWQDRGRNPRGIQSMVSPRVHPGRERK